MLPFVDMSPDGDQEYFGDGMAEELINALTRLGGLHVAARTSTFALKGREDDVREIGRKLGVASVLEGSVRKSGGRLRITAQLIDVDSGYHQWSDTYDRELDDVFAIQDEITRAVVDELKVKLLAGADESLVPAPTRSSEAYELYMRGRYFWYRRYVAPLHTALEYFQKAIELDPNFALAYTGVADAYSVLGLYHLMDIEEARARAFEAANRALELDPELAQAHAALGFAEISVGWGNWEKGIDHCRRAIELNPNYGEARGWLGIALASLGRIEEGLASAQTAVERDPHSTYARAVHGWVRLSARHDEKGLALDQEVLELEPENVLALAQSSFCLRALGRHEEAVAAARKVVEITNGPPVWRAVLAVALGAGGRREAAQVILDDLSALRGDHPSGYLWRGFAAIGAGRLDLALELLLEAVDRREPFSSWFGGARISTPSAAIRASERRWSGRGSTGGSGSGSWTMRPRGAACPVQSSRSFSALFMARYPSSRK